MFLTDAKTIKEVIPFPTLKLDIQTTKKIIDTSIPRVGSMMIDPTFAKFIHPRVLAMR